MPFNGSGTFSIVNTFIPNTTILSSEVNANFADIASGLSNVLTRDGQAGMTAALKAITGSAGAPSITFTADATTGIYLISAGNLGLTTSGILAATFDSSQVMTLAQLGRAKLWTVVDTADASTSSNINTLATAGTGAIAIGTSTNWATNGYLLCGSEVMSYTIASATSLTINTRGDLGSSSISHATGSTISMLYSALAYNDLLLPARTTANRPASPAPGDFGFNTGSGGLEFYSGSGWTTISQPNIPPQGYLSPTAGTPIITGDATSQATIYYNPYVGNYIPIPNAGAFSLQTFSTAAIALSVSQAVNGIYDVYGFTSTTNSTLTFGFSPSWAAGSGGSVTAGSCARGTGAGGTALTRSNGYLVNANAMTVLNGANSYSIASASGIYLGSVYINPATAGTVNLDRSYGQSRQWGIWNAYNKVPIYLKAGDSTASWVYGTATVRYSNNTSANSLMLFSGLAEDVYSVSFSQAATNQTSQINPVFRIGLNSAGATAVGFYGQVGVFNGGPNIQTAQAKYTSTPLLGINQINSLESSTGGSSSFYGTEAQMLIDAMWKG